MNTDAATQLQVRRKMVQLLASSPSSVPMAVFLLGRQLRLLQNFTTDTRLLRAAAERALTLEATNLQAKDARDDPLSQSSLLEEMAGPVFEALRALYQCRNAPVKSPAK